MMGDLNEDQREMIVIAVAGAESLMELINGLLDVEKMESGAMELDPVLLDAAELVAEAVSQISQLADSNKLTLSQEIDDNLPPFMGDENTLRRTLINLLGNAFKFTPSGGAVTVRVRNSLEHQGLMFSISDTGVGILPEAFESIFAKFGQVRPAQGTPMMGTGLGLTFCKLAVEAHGGHIGVQSDLEVGSTFWFTIPLRQTATLT
jgi:signal transduction histidine kinase